MIVCLSVDIDECAIYSCQQCTNTNGSYNCQCNAGYKLVDNKICEGIVIIQPNHLTCFGLYVRNAVNCGETYNMLSND